jgi:tetratricopeptide (TPR) repeat protein
MQRALLGWGLVLVLLSGPVSRGEERSEEEQKQLREQAEELLSVARRLHQRGQYREAFEQQRRCHLLLEQLYPKEKYPRGHRNLLASLYLQGSQLANLNQFQAALPFVHKALTMGRGLYPKKEYPNGHLLLVKTLQLLGSIYLRQGQHDKAEPCCREALEMARRLYPRGHPELARCLNLQAAYYDALCCYEKSLPCYQQALEELQRLPAAVQARAGMLRVQYLNNMAITLEEIGQHEKALECFQQALEIGEQLYPEKKFPDGHPFLLAALNNLAAIYQAMGQYEKALEYCQKCLRMGHRLYPKDRYPRGGPSEADRLTNLGKVLAKMGKTQEALAVLQQALEMTRQRYPEKVYPRGHPDLAASLNCVGTVYRDLAQMRKALEYQQQALDMYRKLYPRTEYPRGHRELARALMNWGGLLWILGKPEEALRYTQQALSMLEQLYPPSQYPNGHPLLNGCLLRKGQLLHALGKHREALTLYQQTLEMRQRLIRANMATSTEGDLLARIGTLPGYTDLLLSATRELAGGKATGYPLVWRQRSLTTRVLAARLHQVRIAVQKGDDPELLHNWEQFLATRRSLSRLLLRALPREGPALAARDERVRQLTERAQELERQLARKVPILERRNRLDSRGPKDLIAALPRGAVFVDVVRYTCTRFTRQSGRIEPQESPRYMGFVLAPGQPVRRVDLGEAEVIEDALEAWRQAIAQRRSHPAATVLRQRLWQPLARHFPAGTHTVYLAPDGPLSRLPWAALPGDRPGTILLEQYTLATLPHGEMLLEQLLHKATPLDGKTTIVALGGARYDDKPSPGSGNSLALRGPVRDDPSLHWEFLAGSEKEARTLQQMGGERVLLLRGQQASVSRLCEELPHCRLAHLATHGFFNQRLFQQELLRRENEAKAFRSGKVAVEEVAQRGFAGRGAESPLSYCGLVLAGANRPERAGVGEGILTGEGIVGLPLGTLYLGVLSACRTGLGGQMDGECVRNLQLAFHLAGCRNVVGSLWDVPDAGTAALMAVFYHELLQNGQSPVQALRRAQLYLYRHPGEIKELAERGPPRKGIVDIDGQERGGARAAIKDWAGFILSGSGQ